MSCVCVLQDSDEVDAAVREVNKLLGDARGEQGRGTEGDTNPTSSSTVPHSLLKVDRRYCVLFSF